MIWSRRFSEIKIASNARRDKAHLVQACAELKSWLSQLPLTSIDTTCDLVMERVNNVRCTPAPAQARYRSLALIEQVADYLSTTLCRQIISTAALHAATARHATSKTLLLHGELALAYQAAALELTASTSWGLKALSAGSIHCALHHLRKMLLVSYMRYSPIPAGTWEQIHDLYKLAEKNRLLARTVWYRENNKISRNRIAHSYTRIVLLALAHAHGLAPEEILALDGLLQECAAHSRLRPVRGAHAPTGAMIIKPCGDASPCIRQREVIADPLIETNLDSSATTGCMQIHISTRRLGLRLARRQHAEGTGMKLESKRVHHLLATWQSPRPRAQPRSDCVSPVAAVFGFYHVAGEHLPRGNAQQQTTPTSPAYLAARQPCSILNQHAEGLCLSVSPPAPAGIRVGEILALTHLHGAYANHLQLGIIRWVKMLENERMECGIQRFPDNALLLRIHASAPGISSRDPLPAILINETRDGKFISMVLLPTLRRHLGETLRASGINDTELQLEQLQLIETTGPTQRYRCTVSGIIYSA